MLKETQWINFFADCSDYIMSENKTFTLKGDSSIAEASGEVLAKSKKLYDVLCNEDSKTEHIREAIIQKKRAARKFYSLTGIHWPF